MPISNICQETSTSSQASGMISSLRKIQKPPRRIKNNPNNTRLFDASPFSIISEYLIFFQPNLLILFLSVRCAALPSQGMKNHGHSGSNENYRQKEGEG